MLQTDGEVGQRATIDSVYQFYESNALQLSFLPFQRSPVGRSLLSVLGSLQRGLVLPLPSCATG